MLPCSPLGSRVGDCGPDWLERTVRLVGDSRRQGVVLFLRRGRAAVAWMTGSMTEHECSDLEVVT